MAKETGQHKDDERVNPEEFLAAQAELRYLREKYGIEDPDAKKEGRISRRISAIFDRSENREKVAVNRKRFLLLLVFTGIFGGHRFYARHYKLGVFYLLTCWTGMSIAMSIIDLLQYLPYPVDDDGNILV